MEELRELSVHVDGVQIAKGLRMTLKGRSTMCLRPDYWILNIYNLSGFAEHQVRNAKEIIVCGLGKSELCRGSVEDIYRHSEGVKDITTIAICDGGKFWDSSISISLASGNKISQTVRTIISRCSSPIKMVSYQANDGLLSRGQVFHGKTVKYVSDLAKSVFARAFLTRGAIGIFGKGKAASVIRIKPESGLLEISRTNNAVIARMGVVQGFAVGQLVEIPEDAKRYRLICQSIDADNHDGVWQTELLMADESQMTDEEWSGGI